MLFESWKIFSEYYKQVKIAKFFKWKSKENVFGIRVNKTL